MVLGIFLRGGDGRRGKREGFGERGNDNTNVLICQGLELGFFEGFRQ